MMGDKSVGKQEGKREVHDRGLDGVEWPEWTGVCIPRYWYFCRYHLDTAIPYILSYNLLYTTLCIYWTTFYTNTRSCWSWNETSNVH